MLPEVNRINKIRELHKQIAHDFKITVGKAIEIGELLTEQKTELNHGEFTPWIEANLPFTERTARSYMRLYRERDKIENGNVSGLAGAYKALAAPQEVQKFEDVKLLEDRKKRLAEYIRIRDKAVACEQKAAEDRIRAEREAGKLLNEAGKFKYLTDLLTTEWCEISPVGLNIKRESTKEEWLDYGKRLKRMDSLLSDWN